ncbi:uracil-DNA glycosylase [Blochmannia endosymbiont of Camponotus (Colobopsis) obliquus]|uniref:uracil-DNA glycosylase n=1 Tax=Blochmannia endosymbiont of Camponotus (Colobopsis) obliquus TaxID=1505597 RepID=UPI00061A6F31|nr:uracil-DNA glycosylase [Blochmannia endosymbiont of Camponotus (Colobopsis) obliquus]AKC60692.1 uracil-DNA glycosylase [Blochmannia endosymbiont of Camponotus (Colobopsis) obliquus]
MNNLHYLTNKKNFSWKSFVAKEKKLTYFKNIFECIKKQQKQGITIYPNKKDIFNAFHYTAFNNVKVVIIGQDPYHQPQQAHGLCFSVPIGIKIPPSLLNIYAELKSDISDFIIPNHGCLKNWAIQGVLLLNCILTVQKGIAHSHSNLGWEIFTDKIIQSLNYYQEKIIFLLWGAYANKKKNIINPQKHYILQSSHPSPLSAHLGFFGCRHFSKTNKLLTINKLKPINWQP